MREPKRIVTCGAMVDLDPIGLNVKMLWCTRRIRVSEGVVMLLWNAAPGGGSFTVMAMMFAGAQSQGNAVSRHRRAPRWAAPHPQGKFCL